MSDAPETPGATPAGSTSVLEREELSIETPWTAVLFNDPVNVMPYVTAVLMQVLKVDKDEAERLMLIVHMDGKVTVCDGDRDDMERIVTELKAAQLWAQVQHV